MSQTTISGISNLTLRQFLDRYTSGPSLRKLEWGPSTSLGVFVTVEDSRGRRAFYLLTDASSTVNVSQLVTVGTLVGKTGTVTTTAATADQVVLTYTVTAGKTFYVFNLDMSADLTGLSATGLYLGAASLELPSGTKLITQDFQNQTDEEVDFKGWTFPVPLRATSAQVIRVVTTPSGVTSTRWRANFSGFEL